MLSRMRIKKEVAEGEAGTRGHRLEFLLMQKLKFISGGGKFYSYQVEKKSGSASKLEDNSQANQKLTSIRH